MSGRDRGRPAVVYALGWCGHGLALSVASGAWIARLVFDARRLDGPWFRPSAPRTPFSPLLSPFVFGANR